MKNTTAKMFTNILICITIICIVAGLLINLSMFNFGINTHGFNFGKTTKDTVSVDKYSSIDVNLDIGSIEFEPGNNFEVYYKYPENYIPKIEVKNNTLTIKSSKNHNRFHNFNNVNTDYKVVVYIPKDSNLENIKASLAMGSIKFSDVDTPITKCDLNIKANMGEVVLNNIEFNNSVIEANMGEVNLTDCNFASCKLSANMGSVKVNNCKGEHCEASTNMGSIDVDDSDIKGFNLDTDMGSVKVDGENKGTSYRTY